MTLTVISAGEAVPWAAYGTSVDNASGDGWPPWQLLCATGDANFGLLDL